MKIWDGDFWDGDFFGMVEIFEVGDLEGLLVWVEIFIWEGWWMLLVIINFGFFFYDEFIGYWLY